MDEIKVSNNFTMSWHGFKDFENLLDQITDDFGEKDAQKILRNACRTAMIPVLNLSLIHI